MDISEEAWRIILLSLLGLSGLIEVASLLARADLALYAAKQSGRNRTFQHNGETCQLVEKAKTAPQADTITPAVAR